MRISGEGLLFARFPKAAALPCVPLQKVSFAVWMFTYPIGSGLGQVLIELTVLFCTRTRVPGQDSSITLLPSYVLFSFYQISGCD